MIATRIIAAKVREINTLSVNGLYTKTLTTIIIIYTRSTKSTLAASCQIATMIKRLKFTIFIFCNGKMN